MEKKEFPKPKIEPEFSPAPSGLSTKISGLGNKLFGVVKFILGLCLLVFVYSTTIIFLSELRLVEKASQGYLWSGVITMVLIYLFVWEPAIIYAKGQKILEVVFNFFRPLVRVAPYLLPIYTIIIFIVYQLLSLGIKSIWLIQYSVFLLGFSIALHLVYSAKTLRSKRNDFLKGNYIFGFSFVYILNLMLLAFCISLIFSGFSFVNFCNNSFSLAKDIFYTVFKQLFFV